MTSHITSTSRRLRMHLVAAVAASALLLTGCNSGSDPGGTSSASPTSTASPSATPTPTATPAYVPASASGRAQNVPVPVLPEVAKTETKEGLEAFAAYWFEQLNYAYQTGDIAGIQAVTSPACQFCSNITGSLTTNYQGGRWLAGGKIVIPSSASTFERGSGGAYQVIVQVQQSTISYYDPSGSEFRTPTEPSDGGNVLLVAFQDAAWRVTGLHSLR
ncbi:DUF6318 family protein [Pseudarthrobacter cellobiosi]|uniref:DUF6318 family protein n=1 Tax=Pseudarthrobacter cellobiosi TaxID=2953654 RepID=UPI0027E378A3|nr:DUF6318 family protein [Pseudarthrobacter sp. HLT1-5]